MITSLILLFIEYIAILDSVAILLVIVNRLNSRDSVSITHNSIFSGFLPEISKIKFKFLKTVGNKIYSQFFRDYLFEGILHFLTL